MRINTIMLLVSMMIFVEAVTGQDYITRGNAPDLHLLHSVAPKQTLSSLSRLYHIPSSELAAYNKIPAGQPLHIGQSVKVPLTKTNFSQNDTKASGEVFLPVYHIIGEKEWLYRISVNHNKVPVETLEKWNGITRDEAKAGMKLIVGYLRVKEGNAVLATHPSGANKSTNVPASPGVVGDAPTFAGSSSPSTTEKRQAASARGGYFKSGYEESGTKSSGVAGIFKSTSGWNDGKYYALMNNVTVGTIVKIILPRTNKAVFAKVLGELPDMKESDGLALRISDAAASELGAVNNKFSVDVAF